MSSQDLDLDSVSKWLIDNQYLLSGLELYQESLEGGIHSQYLSDFFTLDHIDSFVNKEDLSEWLESAQSLRSPRGNQKVEPIPSTEALLTKISTLEYTLRQEMSHRQNLRKELSHLTEEMGIFKNNQEQGSSTATEKPVSSIERRILNHVIYKYLMDQNLKKTAISLSSEVKYR